MLSDTERATLGEIGRRLGRKLLGEVANVAQPDTILAWYRKHVARKFDGSKERRTPGRPRLDRAIEELTARMAQEVAGTRPQSSSKRSSMARACSFRNHFSASRIMSSSGNSSTLT